MKLKQKLAAFLLAVTLISLPACGNKDTDKSSGPDSAGVSDITDTAKPVINNTELADEIPSAYLTPMNKLLSEWGSRKGSMSDPMIGARILMYDKTKDEVGFAILDIDGDGVDDMIVAPIDDFKKNAMVYDILTIKDGEAWHLANSLEATYHFMADGSFILRTPTEEKSYTFKRVTLNGADKPTETPITEAEAAKQYISTVELTPFSALEK